MADNLELKKLPREMPSRIQYARSRFLFFGSLFCVIIFAAFFLISLNDGFEIKSSFWFLLIIIAVLSRHVYHGWKFFRDPLIAAFYGDRVYYRNIGLVEESKIKSVDWNPIIVKGSVTGYILKIKRLLISGEEQTKKMYVLPFRDTQDAAEIKKIITSLPYYRR